MLYSFFHVIMATFVEKIKLSCLGSTACQWFMRKQLNVLQVDKSQLQLPKYNILTLEIKERKALLTHQESLPLQLLKAAQFDWSI